MSVRSVFSGWVLLTLVGTGGCVTDVAPPAQVLWEAELVGAPAFPDLTGGAAALSTDRVSLASIQLENFPPGSYLWGIYQGSCGIAGDLLGWPANYEGVTVTGVEEASVEAQISAPMPRGQLFHAVVRDADSEEEMACGDFEEWQG